MWAGEASLGKSFDPEAPELTRGLKHVGCGIDQISSHPLWVALSIGKNEHKCFMKSITRRS
jgi:hypothetical protein